MNNQELIEQIEQFKKQIIQAFKDVFAEEMRDPKFIELAITNPSLDDAIKTLPSRGFRKGKNKADFKIFHNLYTTVVAMEQLIGKIPDEPDSKARENLADSTIVDALQMVVIKFSSAGNYIQQNSADELKKIDKEVTSLSAFAVDFDDKAKDYKEQLNKLLTKLNDLEESLVIHKKNGLESYNFDSHYVENIIKKFDDINTFLPTVLTIQATAKNISASSQPSVTTLQGSASTLSQTVYDTINQRQGAIFQPTIQNLAGLSAKNTPSQLDRAAEGLATLNTWRKDAEKVLKIIQTRKKLVSDTLKKLDKKIVLNAKFTAAKNISDNLKEINNDIDKWTKELTAKTQAFEDPKVVIEELQRVKKDLEKEQQAFADLFNDEFTKDSAFRVNQGFQSTERQLTDVNQAISKITEQATAYQSFYNFIQAFPEKIKDINTLEALNAFTSELDKLKAKAGYGDNIPINLTENLSTIEKAIKTRKSLFEMEISLSNLFEKINADPNNKGLIIKIIKIFEDRAKNIDSNTLPIELKNRFDHALQLKKILITYYSAVTAISTLNSNIDKHIANPAQVTAPTVAQKPQADYEVVKDAIDNLLNVINEEINLLNMAFPSVPLIALNNELSEKVTGLLLGQSLSQQNTQSKGTSGTPVDNNTPKINKELIESLKQLAQPFEKHANTHAALLTCIAAITTDAGSTVPHKQKFIDKLKQYVEHRKDTLGSTFSFFHKTDLARQKINLAEKLIDLLTRFDLTPKQMDAMIELFQCINKNMETEAHKTYLFKSGGAFAAKLNEISQDLDTFANNEQNNNQTNKIDTPQPKTG